MEKKLVSIIIPVYNGENYLKEAIDSALSQTYKNIEIIVINDGSKDKTEEIAKSYGKKIRYYKKENGGVSTALNYGIQKMRGEYFSWLSHDDLYLPNKIEYQIKYLSDIKENISNIILYSNYNVINENGTKIGEKFLNTEELSKKTEYALLRGSINGITLLIPKKAFIDYGHFDEKLRCTQDYEMWERMSKSYRFVHIPQTLASTRIHSNQDTNTNPKVIVEGNKLWINMIENISDSRKIELEGTLYNFYYEQSKFLSETPYLETLKYCVNKLNEIDKLNKISISHFLNIKKQKISIVNIFKKTINSFKTTGIKKTIQKVIRFIMNRRK